MPKGIYTRNKETGRKIGKANTKHGGCVGGNSKLYRVWANMKYRCCNENHTKYPRYGGRGIYVIPKWQLGFENFRDWSLANGYKEGLTIDRIDNDEGYMPQNCQWIPLAENAGKRRNSNLSERKR